MKNIIVLFVLISTTSFSQKQLSVGAISISIGKLDTNEKYIVWYGFNYSPTGDTSFFVNYDTIGVIKSLYTEVSRIREQLWAAQKLLSTLNCIPVPDNKYKNYLKAQKEYDKIMGYTDKKCSCTPNKK